MFSYWDEEDLIKINKQQKCNSYKNKIQRRYMSPLDFIYVRIDKLEISDLSPSLCFSIFRHTNYKW